MMCSVEDKICATSLLSVIIVISVSVDYIGALCGVRGDETPDLRGIHGGDVCAVTDTRPCDQVHIYSTYFAVNPSFACRVVVSIGPLMTL